MPFKRHSLHRRLLAVRFLFFFKVLSKMGTYHPVSISNGRIPVLNCDTRERRRRDIYRVILDNICFWFKYILNIMYVLSLGVFFLLLFSIWLHNYQ